MTRVVVDTNVLVAGLLSRKGPPARIVGLILAGQLVPVVSPDVLAEYEAVLNRPELALPREDVSSVIAYFRLPGDHVAHVDPIQIEAVCPDPQDDKFVAAAVDGHAAYLITGNTRHFPRSRWRDTRIVTPTNFMEIFRAGGDETRELLADPKVQKRLKEGLPARGVPLAAARVRVRARRRAR